LRHLHIVLGAFAELLPGVFGRQRRKQLSRPFEIQVALAFASPGLSAKAFLRGGGDVKEH
jgi:hypothetical protein